MGTEWIDAIYQRQRRSLSARTDWRPAGISCERPARPWDGV